MATSMESPQNNSVSNLDMATRFSLNDGRAQIVRRHMNGSLDLDNHGSPPDMDDVPSSNGSIEDLNICSSDKTRNNSVDIGQIRLKLHSQSSDQDEYQSCELIGHASSLFSPPTLNLFLSLFSFAFLSQSLQLIANLLVCTYDLIINIIYLTIFIIAYGDMI